MIPTLLFSCKGKGSLTGNATYSLNRIIGDRPDGSSDIYLFPYDKNDSVIYAECDLNGNFSFNNIPSGKYVLIGVSGKATGSPADNYFVLYNSQYMVDLGFFFFKLDSNLEKKATDLVNVRQQLLVYKDDDYDEKGKNARDSLQLIEGLANKLSDSLINMIPQNSRLLRNMAVVGIRKLSMEYVTVENDKTNTQTVNFGSTYY